MRQKENISDLLKRYILNECSYEEIERVISYFKNSTNSDDTPTVEEVLELLKQLRPAKDGSSDVHFKDVLQAAKAKEIKKPANRPSLFPLRGYSSIAAIFIGIAVVGYFFLKSRISDVTIAVPSDAITLELEDGSIEILNEDGTKEVKDKNGTILGKQTGNQISYEGKKPSKELVYNTLKVPYGKRFGLKLSDGTMVNLNAGTSLRYPVNFLEGRNRKVFLNGEAFFDVKRDSINPFIVSADELNVQVLGTRFNISSYPEDDRADVVLVEGSVGMHGKTGSFDKSESTILEPGYKGIFEKTSGKIKTQAVLTDIYTSWIDGEFVFRKMTFENLLRKMERHYDVSITNNNKELANEVFNASYGKISLRKVLEDLKVTYGIDYSIEETNITIN